MSDPLTSVTSDDGFTVTSNAETSEQITESLKPPAEGEKEESIAEAAARLGKKGGEAAAAKRAAEAKEQAKAEKETSAEPEPEPEPEPEEGKEKPKPEDAKSRARQRVEQAARDAAEARKALAAERERAERAERALAEREYQRQAQQQPSTKPADDRPKEEDFENYADFVEARSRWAAREEFARQFEARRQEAAQRYMADTIQRKFDARAGQYQERVAKASETAPDLYERIHEPVIDIGGQKIAIADLAPTLPGQNPTPFSVIADEIFSSGLAPDLMLYFQKQPEELKRIAMLSTPREVSREILKLEARLDDATAGNPPSNEHAASKPQPVSRASPPVRPVAGSPHTADAAPDPDSSSFDEHLRFYNAKERRAR